MTLGALYQARGVLVSPPCPWLLPSLGVSPELVVREAQASVGELGQGPGVGWALRTWRQAGIRTPDRLETVAQLADWGDRTDRWTQRVPSLGAIALFPPALVGIVIRLEPLLVVLPDDGILTARRVPLHDAAAGYCHVHAITRS